jgi:protein involved in polysaccharide export with SLBB domain
MQKHQRVFFLRLFSVTAFLILSSLYIFGCSSGISSNDQIDRFNKAGPLNPETNLGYTPDSKDLTGPYRIIAGDVLEFQMPAVLRVISSDLPEWLRPTYGRTEAEPYLVRVAQDGTITLPIIGQINAAGYTLAQIEASVVDAYYPKYVVAQPMVVCEVKKYQRESERIFAVIGLVNKSGIFPYPSDVHYNLMEAIAFAGGLDMVADPHYLKIYRQDSSGETLCVTLRMDGNYLTEAYRTNVQPGDLIYVDHTLHTRINKFFAEVFHITVGAESRLTYD